MTEDLDAQAHIIGHLGYVKAQHEFNPNVYVEWCSLESLVFMQLLRDDLKTLSSETKENDLKILRILYTKGLVEFKKEKEILYFKLK